MTPHERGLEVFASLQRAARRSVTDGDRPTPTAEFVLRHALESFLHRLTLTPEGQRFVLKGGVLLAAYGVRRATRDLDAEVALLGLAAETLRDVVAHVAASEVDDGVVFDLSSLRVQQIREDAEYPAFRVKVTAVIGDQRVPVTWDVSSGDPIVPDPQLVDVPRVLGGDIETSAYRPETILAEKGVTILERGTTSTRWRDYVDIVQLNRRQLVDPASLETPIDAVAAYRRVPLGLVADALRGHDAGAQSKWAAWRRKAGVEEISEPELEAQVRLVAEALDPALTTLIARSRASRQE